MKTRFSDTDEKLGYSCAKPSGCRSAAAMKTIDSPWSKRADRNARAAAGSLRWPWNCRYWSNSAAASSRSARTAWRTVMARIANALKRPHEMTWPPGRRRRGPEGRGSRSAWTEAGAPSARDVRLDQRRQLGQRLLPAEIAHLERDHLGDVLLHDGQLGPADDRAQLDGDGEDAGQVRIVELVGVADQLVRNQLEVLATERVPVAGREVAERHPERAADDGLEVVNRAGEAVRRQPLGHRIG